MYKVIKFFTDGQDNGHPYNVGDEYPRKGLKPTPERLGELLGNGNKRGKPMIVEVEEVETADVKPEEVETADAVVEVPEKPKARKPRKKATKK